jgi:hypothetical protein
LATPTADLRVLGDLGWVRVPSIVRFPSVQGHDTFHKGDLAVTLECHHGDVLAGALGLEEPERHAGRRFWHFGVSVRTAPRAPTDEQVQDVIDDLGQAGVMGPWYEQRSVLWRHVRHFFEANRAA